MLVVHDIYIRVIKMSFKVYKKSYLNIWDEIYSLSFSLEFLGFVKTLVFHVFTAKKCFDKNKKIQ